jgi:hypothetical protein
VNPFMCELELLKLKLILAVTSVKHLGVVYAPTTQRLIIAIAGMTGVSVRGGDVSTLAYLGRAVRRRGVCEVR